MQKWNLIHLISSDRWTGAAEPATNLVDGLRRRGHTVRVGLIRGLSFEMRLRERGIDLIDDLHLHRGFNPLKDLADARLLTRLVRDEGVDLIHCHLNKDHWLAGITKRLHRLPCPLVRTQHRISNGRRRNVGKGWLYGRVTDATIVLGESLRLADAAISKLPREKVHVIHGGVNTEAFHPDKANSGVREALGIPRDSPVVGMIAHFKPGRGWHTAVPALAKVHAVYPDAHFILAGGHSRMVKWVRSHMSEMGCLDQTLIISDNRFEWPALVAAMDMSVWLAPGSEATGRAVLEVMASGHPVVAGNLGIASEVIDNGVDGVIVPEGVTIDGLAKTVCDLLGDRDRLTMMGHAAREKIETEFNLERQVDEVEALYRKLLT